MMRPLLAALVVALPSSALAYDLKTTSTGAPLRWMDGSIVLELALADGPDLTRAESEAAAASAVASWQDGLVDSAVTFAIAAAGEPATATGDGIPSVRWAVDEEDPEVEVGRLAMTKISYRIADGAIQDADVVVNAAEFEWTVAPDGCQDQYDLESTLSHELGHLLGLGHSVDPEATMFATGSECETMKRDLSPDDRAGLDDLYRNLPPLDELPLDTDTTVEAAGCAAGGGTGALSGLFVLVALIGLRGRIRVLGGALIAVTVSAGSASAGELRQVELAELGGRSDLVIRGVVVAARPVRGVELSTDSEVRVTTCFAGDCPATVQVRRRGGEQAGQGLWVDGEAELSAGQEVVLYLRARPDGGHRVIGGVQGVLRVVRQGGSTFALRDLRGHRVLAGGSWRDGGLQLIDLAAVPRSVAPAR